MIEAFSMREDEKFQIIWENAQKMPEMERAMFYELERKKPIVGLCWFFSFLPGVASSTPERRPRASS